MRVLKMATMTLSYHGVVPCNSLNCSDVTSAPDSSMTNSSFDINVFETPKGYSVPHIIWTSILISVIMFLIVFGHLLVVIVIFTDRTLKSTQNWFIASLAVADFLLGLVIMPFSLANEMMGYWYFGRVWCDLWKAIDVLLCTASILSICLISLDRYWSITRALQYSSQRTGKRAALMIAAVWFLSAIICVPPLIGWKNPLPVSDYPLCLLSADKGYVLYSTMGSFYIPCVIMVFVYFKIYLAARRLARKNVTKKKAKLRVEVKEKCNVEYSTITSHKNKVIHDQFDDTSDIKDSPIRDRNEESIQDESSESGNVDDEPTMRIHDEVNAPKQEHDEQNNVLNTDSSKDTEETDDKPFLTYGNNETKVKVTTEQNNIINTSNTHAETNATFIKHMGKRFSKKQQRINGNKTSKGWRTASLREHERHKKKIAKARERRATIVLGIVMAAFILCWFPFFTLYIITSFCDCIGEIVFTVVFWAGYCNSALNPIIYTIFNREFRKAFHRIVFKKLLRCR